MAFWHASVRSDQLAFAKRDSYIVFKIRCMACHLKLAPGLQSTAVANFVLKRTEGVCAKNLANLSLQSALTVRCHALVLCSRLKWTWSYTTRGDADLRFCRTVPDFQLPA